MADLADRISHGAVAALDLAPNDERFKTLQRQVLQGGAARFARVVADDQPVRYVIPVALAVEQVEYGALVVQSNRAAVVWRDSRGLDRSRVVDLGFGTTATYRPVTLAGATWTRFDMSGAQSELSFLAPPTGTSQLRMTLVHLLGASPRAAVRPEPPDAPRPPRAPVPPVAPVPAVAPVPSVVPMPAAVAMAPPPAVPGAATETPAPSPTEQARRAVPASAPTPLEQEPTRAAEPQPETEDTPTEIHRAVPAQGDDPNADSRTEDDATVILPAVDAPTAAAAAAPSGFAPDAETPTAAFAPVFPPSTASPMTSTDDASATRPLPLVPESPPSLVDDLFRPADSTTVMPTAPEPWPQATRMPTPAATAVVEPARGGVSDTLRGFLLGFGGVTIIGMLVIIATLITR